MRKYPMLTPKKKKKKKTLVIPILHKVDFRATKEKMLPVIEDITLINIFKLL